MIAPCLFIRDGFTRRCDRGRVGGGGGHFHVHIRYVPRETSIFSPKFPLECILFSQIRKKSAPEHHHFTIFASPEIIIFKISLPSSHSVAAHGRFTAAGQRPGFTAGQSASQTRSTSQLRRPPFHARVRSRAPHFHARATPEPPIFHFAVAHTYQNVGRVSFPLTAKAM